MKSFSKTLQVYLHISAEDLYWKERNRKKSGQVMISHDKS